LTQVTEFLVVYGLGLGMIAEWFFWEEFSVRFNFISVDYLVYRREATDNCCQRNHSAFNLILFVDMGIAAMLVYMLMVVDMNLFIGKNSSLFHGKNLISHRVEEIKLVRNN